MKTFIVVCDGMDSTIFSNLQKFQEFEVYPKSKIQLKNLQKELPKINAIIIRSVTTVDRKLIEKMPALKYVIRAGEGTDNIDRQACKEKGIKVSNTPGANNNSAAEHAFALMLTVLRKTAWAHQSMTQGKWEKSKFLGNELFRKKVGIVGVGRIGTILIKRLAGFEPNILYYDPFIDNIDCSFAKKALDLKNSF